MVAESGSMIVRWRVSVKTGSQKLLDCGTQRLSLAHMNKNIPWSCDSWRRRTEDEDVGLGGMVVMTGAPEITTEAGMGTLSCSMLGLDGSSEDR